MPRQQQLGPARQKASARARCGGGVGRGHRRQPQVEGEASFGGEVNSGFTSSLGVLGVSAPHRRQQECRGTPSFPASITLLLCGSPVPRASPRGGEHVEDGSIGRATRRGRPLRGRGRIDHLVEELGGVCPPRLGDPHTPPSPSRGARAQGRRGSRRRRTRSQGGGRGRRRGGSTRSRSRGGSGGLGEHTQCQESKKQSRGK